MNVKSGHIGQGCVNMDSLWATSTKFLLQSKSGIVSSLVSYMATYTNTKKEKPSWIHHYAILPLFHPCFHVYLHDNSKVNFLNDNHHLFLRQLTPEDLKSYVDINEDSPNYSYFWVGEGGCIG
jgi:hypothetical protein